MDQLCPYCAEEILTRLGQHVEVAAGVDARFYRTYYLCRTCYGACVWQTSDRHPFHEAMIGFYSGPELCDMLRRQGRCAEAELLSLLGMGWRDATVIDALLGRLADELVPRRLPH